MNPYKPHLTPKSGDIRTRDSFQNFLAKVGINAGNLSSGGHYGFNPITRNRLQMEWAYRGSWIVGAVVDAVAEDMTRKGVKINSDDSPAKLDKLKTTIRKLGIWSQLADVVRWGRLYGGAIGWIRIEGQDHSTPLKLDTVGKGQFTGIVPLDRWSLQPSLDDIIGSQDDDPTKDIGNPRYYDLFPDGLGTGLPLTRIHYTRAIRHVGVRLPYWQKITENLWGQSVIERLWDRLLAFDSSTQGLAQMAYKAYLRILKIPGLRDIIAQGGPVLDGIIKNVEMIRAYQSNEGITLLDADDDMQTLQYSFAGLDSVLIQFGQQLSGAAEIPLVRLFGQSPVGMNSTGESDWRNYFDGINRKQENEMRDDVEKVYELAYRSTFGAAPPSSFKLEFETLWELTDGEATTVTNQGTAAITEAYDKQLIKKSTAQKELRQLGDKTGIFTNITDEDIKQSEDEEKHARENPPSPEELGLSAIPGQGGPAASSAAPAAGGEGRPSVAPRPPQAPTQNENVASAA